MSWSVQGSTLLPGAAAIAACLLAWAASTGVEGSPAAPGPLMVWTTLLDILFSRDFWSSLLATIGRIIIGSTMALLVGTALAVTMQLREVVARPISLLVSFGLAVPALVWAMLSVSLYGASEAAATVAIVGVVTPFIVTSMAASIAEVSPLFLKVSKVFAVSIMRTLTWYILPNVTRSMISAYKTALALSWKVVVIVETFGLDSGIGQELAAAFSLYDISKILAITILFMVLMACVHRLLDLLAPKANANALA